MKIALPSGRRIRFILQLLLTLAVCAFLIVPVGVSMLAGVTVNFARGIESGLTTRWLLLVWQQYDTTIYSSLIIAVLCLIVTLILGVPAAYALAVAKGRVSRVIEEMLVLPIAVPGFATAIALILAYGSFREFRLSYGFILIGHVLFTLPFMVRSVLAVMASIDLKTLEEGAASLGAGFWRRFWTVVLPNAAPGILAGALMVVTLSIGEFNISLMLHTPTTKTLPVGLADAYGTERLEIGSAYTFVFLVMILPLLLALQAIGRPRKKKTLPADVVEETAPLTAPPATARVTTEISSDLPTKARA